MGLPLSSRLVLSVRAPISFLSFTSLARAASASLRFCNLSSCHICHLLPSVKTRLCQVGTVICALRVSSAPNTLRGSRTHKIQARHQTSTANHRQRQDKCFQGPWNGHPTGGEGSLSTASSQRPAGASPLPRSLNSDQTASRLGTCFPQSAPGAATACATTWAVSPTSARDPRLRGSQHPQTPRPEREQESGEDGAAQPHSRGLRRAHSKEHEGQRC